MEIKLGQRHSEDGGFNCVMIESVDGSTDWQDIVKARRLLVSWGMIREIGGGYSDVRAVVIRRLGMEFTSEQVNDLGDELKREAQAHRTRDSVRCDCGHTVSRSHVMSASLGTSCPDCYDRMSN